MNNNKGTIIGLVAVVVIAIGAIVFYMSRQSTSTADTVKDMQNEAARNVPAGLGKPTEEQTHEGLHQMGGGKQSTAPPVGGPIQK